MPKTMFVLMSHDITSLQKEDAYRSYGVENFQNIYDPIWGNIPPEVAIIEPYLDSIKERILKLSAPSDILLVQGDFGATVAMVSFARAYGLIAVYATTSRVAKDIVDGEKIVTIREFQHVRFREYEGALQWQKY